MKLSRRSFFKGIASALGVAAVAPKVLASKVEEIVVDYGFTWGVPPSSNLELDKLVRETLRKNSNLIAKNLEKDNLLLMRLKEKEYRIKINRIDPELQQQRMIERIKNSKGHKPLDWNENRKKTYKELMAKQERMDMEYINSYQKIKAEIKHA